MTIRVECLAEYGQEQAPVRFYLRDRRVEVDEVIDRWFAPGHRYFKVRADDGGIYMLRHDSGSKSWELIMFDSGKVDEIRLSST